MKKYKFFNTKVEKRVGKIFLYGNIGDGERVDPERVAAELEALGSNADKIEVHINSNGGDVFSGIAIYNALKTSTAQISIYIDGVAASMAGVIALCGKPLYMSKHAKLMLHSVSGSVSGNASELREMADFIETLENDLAAMISGKCQMPEAEIIEKYFNGVDHWLNAQECQQMGLLSGIYDLSQEERENVENKTKNAIEFSARKNNITDTKNQITGFIELGIIPKEQESLFVSLAKSDPEEFNKYINKKQILLRKEVTDEIEKAVKSQRLKRDKTAFYNDLGGKIGLQKLKTILEDVAPFTRIDCYIHDKPQPHWTLSDYRKYDPLYLLDHPDFYERLKRQYKNEVSDFQTLDYYRRNHPELLESDPEFYKSLINNQQTRK